MKLLPRLATQYDSNLLFSWANDLAMRSMAIHSDYINYAEHFRWFENIYYSPNYLIYIIEWEGQPIGQVRFDFYNTIDAYIDIYISLPFRGLGLAAEMFNCCAKDIAKTHPFLRFNATVLLGNIASSLLFQRLNFECQGMHARKQKWAMHFHCLASKF